MTNEQSMIKKRFEELLSRSEKQHTWVYSDFCSAGAIGVLQSELPRGGYVVTGGYEGAERCVVCFGSEDDLLLPPAAPIVCIRIAPSAPKFAAALSHRDFLGSLVGLGLRREVLGDILTDENTGYLFCLEQVADFITSQLTQVGRTRVVCSRCSAPQLCLREMPDTVVTAASERADALVAAVFKLSRSQSGELFDEGRVLINSLPASRPDERLRAGDVVSVRTFGRFIYRGVCGQTRKSRLRAVVGVYR